MGRCEVCTGDAALSFECNECAATFCTRHRLPESHSCPAVRRHGDRSPWYERWMAAVRIEEIS